MKSLDENKTVRVGTGALLIVFQSLPPPSTAASVDGIPVRAHLHLPVSGTHPVTPLLLHCRLLALHADLSPGVENVSPRRSVTSTGSARGDDSEPATVPVNRRHT